MCYLLYETGAFYYRKRVRSLFCTPCKGQGRSRGVGWWGKPPHSEAQRPSFEPPKWNDTLYRGLCCTVAILSPSQPPAPLPPLILKSLATPLRKGARTPTLPASLCYATGKSAMLRAYFILVWSSTAFFCFFVFVFVCFLFLFAFCFCCCCCCCFVLFCLLCFVLFWLFVCLFFDLFFLFLNIILFERRDTKFWFEQGAWQDTPRLWA